MTFEALAIALAIAAAPTPAATVKTEPARTLYVCDQSAATQRGFAREFGRVEYVTAREALSSGARWEAPKCITAVEARRLRRLVARGAAH